MSMRGIRWAVSLIAVALVSAVVPSHASQAQPSGGAYAFFTRNGKAPGAYWDPCTPIRYGIDFTYAQRRGLSRAWEVRRWKSAISEHALATGLTFKYAGMVKTRSNGRTPRGGPDLVIVFGSAKAQGRYNYRKSLRGRVAGIGGVQWIDSGDARSRIVRGYVVIDTDELVGRVGKPDPRSPQVRPPDPVRALYMHEFGHALGLDHVEDQGELMYPTLLPERGDAFGRGDLRGLRRLGDQPCF